MDPVHRFDTPVPRHIDDAVQELVDKPGLIDSAADTAESAEQHRLFRALGIDVFGVKSVHWTRSAKEPRRPFS
mgnify:FL=1